MNLDDIKSKAGEAFDTVKDHAGDVVEYAKDHADEAGDYLQETFGDGVQKEDFEKIGNDLKATFGKIFGGDKQE